MDSVLRRLINYLKIILIICTFFCFCPLDINAQYYHENKDNVYVHKSTDEMKIALSFDDGPHPKKTCEILSVLKNHGIKATFFVIGQNAEKHPEILQMIAADGHEIANHTYDHKSIYKLDSGALINDVRHCSDVIEKITGKRPELFRPPEGYMNDTIAHQMKGQGYNVILWRVDTYDWKGRSTSDIFQSVTKSVKCGDIILMHDYIWRKSNTAEAIDRLIPYLKGIGYEFLTVSELLYD